MVEQEVLVIVSGGSRWAWIFVLKATRRLGQSLSLINSLTKSVQGIGLAYSEIDPPVTGARLAGTNIEIEE